MGFIEGLGAIRERLDAEERAYQERKAAADRPKAIWLSLKDKEAVKIYPLQELDKQAPGFSEEKGLGLMSVEHQVPGNFRRKALCTTDHDAGVSCVGCERHRENPKAGWKPKNRLYLNVLVDNGTDEPYVAVLSQSLGITEHIADALLEQAVEFGTITDRWFKFKRSGSGLNDTSYMLTPLKEQKLDISKHEVFDLKEVAVRDIPYDGQAEFYDFVWDPDGKSKTEEKSDSVKAEKPADDEVW